MTPGFLRLSPLDNVAIAVRPEGAVAGEQIPQGHKVALTPIAAGAPVVRYGAVTAYAAVDIAAGAWVREELLRLPNAPALGGYAPRAAAAWSLSRTPMAAAWPSTRRARKSRSAPCATSR